jgi:methylmalonyl-CoA/ethylmalonyl-CoA epimerase
MGIETKQFPGFLFHDHVAISVKQGDLENQVNAYKMMGFTEIHREDVHGKDMVREVLLRIGDGPNLIQLLEPLSADSPVAKQIEKNGGRGGFAHIALRVADIHNAFDYLKEKGVHSSRGTTVFFVHPKTMDTAVLGYVVEVVQEGKA